MSSKDGASYAGSESQADFGRDRVEIPGAIVEKFDSPTTPEDVCDVIKLAAKAETGLLIAGGRTRLHWANPARNISAGLSLRSLSGVLEFEPEEGVLHAAAGTPIRVVQEIANAEGWELALDSPGARSTLGGTIASDATGPRSHVFGRVSDVVLGLDIVGADGVRSKCGGRVVKNVTGYDMAKLYCGSFGSLGVICGAWLRLRPLPPVREAYVLNLEPTSKNFEMIRVKAHGLTVRAVIWMQLPDADHAEVVVEFAGSSEGVAHDRGQFGSGLSWESVPLARVDALRDERSETRSDPVVMRVRVLGSKSGEMARMLLDLGFSVSIDPGIGVIHARGDVDQPGELLEIRTRARRFGGLAFFEHLPRLWREQVDVFDDQGDGASLGLRLKDRFDPARILNPGRYAGRV